MENDFKRTQRKASGTGKSQLDDPPSRLSSTATWMLLVGGGFMAGWGTLVTIALLVILVIQGPGPGGIAPFLAGSVVIGLAPMGFGGFLFNTGRQRYKESLPDNETS